MKTFEEMLRQLVRPDVVEFAVASDRLPCVKVGDRYDPVDDVARNTDAIVEMLKRFGGAPHVKDLATTPAHWTTRIDGVGTVGVQAVMRSGRLQARFAVTVRTATPPGGTPAVVAPVAPVAPAAKAARTVVAVAPPGASAPARGVAPPPLPAASGPRKSAPELAPPIDLVADGPLAQTVPTPPTAPTPTTTVTAATRAAPGLRGEGLPGLLIEAGELAASDLHVVASRPALFRVAGELTPRGAPIDDATVEKMLLPIVPARLRATLDEQGSCDFAFDRPGGGRYRVNVSRQRTGYKGCFRCIPAAVPTLASLGLPPEIERATHHHQGLVLVTGPTGHGKTTTLAAIVDIINAGTSRHIISVEDPVEYVHPRKQAMMSQREVGSHTRSFAAALKASLREDPDVIVVGELRDTETVRMALAASETGHLVIGTMNTPSAAKTVDRVVDLFPPGDQQQVRMTLAGGLHLIIGQRLVPTADGQSMVVASELLPGSIAFWTMIRDAKTFQIPSLQQRGRGFGIFRLDEALSDLVRSGRVTLADALAVAENPDDLESIIEGARAAAAKAAAPPEPPKKEGLFGKAGNLFGKRGG